MSARISPELALVDPELRPRAEEDAPVSATQPEQQSIETLLFRSGFLSADDLASLVRDAVVAQRPVAELALERNYVTPQQLQTLLAREAEPPAAEPAPAPEASAPVELATPPVVLPAPNASLPPVSHLSAVPAAAAAPQPVPVQSVPVQPVPVQAVTPVVHVEVVPAEPAPAELAPVEIAPAELAPVELAPVGVAPVVAEPEPEPVEAVEPAPAPPRLRYEIELRLAGGDRVFVAAAPTLEAASETARETARTVAAAVEWPFFSGRLVRPEAIVSVDVAPRLAP